MDLANIVVLGQLGRSVLRPYREIVALVIGGVVC